MAATAVPDQKQIGQVNAVSLETLNLIGSLPKII